MSKRAKALVTINVVLFLTSLSLAQPVSNENHDQARRLRKIKPDLFDRRRRGDRVRMSLPLLALRAGTRFDG
jgi:hypothetical protein